MFFLWIHKELLVGDERGRGLESHQTVFPLCLDNARTGSAHTGISGDHQLL